MQRLGRVIGNVFAVILAVYSLQAMAEAPLAGRDFNHAATGFPLTGGHAMAACESCHVAGVFKGTAKECDGCHALGRRVVATPKSTSHIVTDSPCETCHFNSSTFLGARFNHGTAFPGQCATCHNGRQSMGKPASHSSGNKATKSCDNCHRSYTWFQASWNHVGVVPGTCGTQCHNGSEAPGQPPGHSNTTQYNLQAKAYYFPACDQCHHYVSWTPAPFKHLVAGTCESCHTYAGKPTPHIAIAVGATCGNCHRLRTSWLPASLHTGNEAGICRTCHATTPQPGSHSGAAYQVSCDACHTQNNWVFNHAAQQGKHTCNSCHSRSNHHGSGTQPCDNCHNVRGW
jgi:predicted CXXCH cytochrome family protein